MFVDVLQSHHKTLELVGVKPGPFHQLNLSAFILLFLWSEGKLKVNNRYRDALLLSLDLSSRSIQSDLTKFRGEFSGFITKPSTALIALSQIIQSAFHFLDSFQMDSSEYD